MPLVYQQDINLKTKLGIWHITEDEFWFDAGLIKNRISHPHKRLQTMAGRYLLKVLYPEMPVELIEVAPTKKPFIPNDLYHFSISHCGDFAAAIVSASHRVGVDIEIPQTKIIKLEQKFLSVAEKQLLLGLGIENETAFTIGWSIKEAVFKWYGKGHLNFIAHMEIVSATLIEKDKFTVKLIFKKEQERVLYLHGQIHFGLCSVFLCT